jgi:SAM-dependent methyltransferase
MPDAVRLEAADVLDLPFEADSFDLIVCFEVLEHLDDPEAGLDELARVLAGGGLLAASSPNRRVFPPGNPHHVREYVPEELRDSLGRRFANVRLARQHTWASSAILGDESLRSGDGRPIEAAAAKSGGLEPGDELYTVALASDAELPAVEDLIVVGPALELGDLAEAKQLRQVIEHKEQRIEELEEVRGRLVDAEQQLAELPALEADRRDLMEMRGSLSWRLTAPLRRGKADLERTVPPARRGFKRLLAALISRLRGGGP